MSNYNITERQFDAYKKVQSSGVVNMFNTQRVAQEMSNAGADTFPNEVKQIHHNFDELSAKYSN